MVTRTAGRLLVPQRLHPPARLEREQRQPQRLGLDRRLRAAVSRRLARPRNSHLSQVHEAGQLVKGTPSHRVAWLLDKDVSCEERITRENRPTAPADQHSPIKSSSLRRLACTAG